MMILIILIYLIGCMLKESKVPCDDLIIVIPVNLMILSLNQMK